MEPWDAGQEGTGPWDVGEEFWNHGMQKRSCGTVGCRALELEPAPAPRSSPSKGSSRHYSCLSISTALSHVAGIQAGGALFPLEISDKNPFPPPFPWPRQDVGVGPGAGAGGAPRAATPKPSCCSKAFLGAGASRAAGEPRTFLGVEISPGWSSSL